ncbi:MAG TPA: GAF domain-containing protein [Gemmatimonadaceae bacterium]
MGTKIVAPATDRGQDRVDPEQAAASAEEVSRRRETEESLRATLTELRAREDALRESEAQLRLVTDALPVLVSFVDSDHRYRFVSAAYEGWFGHSQDRIVGRHMVDVLGPTAYEALKPHVESALAGNSVTFESEISYRDGGTRFIEATYIPKRSAHGEITGFVAFVADATERHLSERTRAEEASSAERLLRVTGGIADAVSAEEVYEALVDRVVDAMGASSGGLWLVDEAANVARLARSRGYTESTAKQLAELPLDIDPGMPAIDSIRRNEAIWIDSRSALLESYPHLASLVTPGRQYKVACLPLTAQGRVLGSLGLSIDSEERVTVEDRNFLQVVARYAGQALERLRLFESERRSRAAADASAQRLRIMARVSRTFVESDLALPARLKAVTTELSRALGGCINISLIGPDDRLRFAAAHHPNPDADAELAELMSRAAVSLGEGVTGTIASTGKSILLSRLEPAEIERRAPRQYHEFLKRYPVWSLVGAPLEANGRIIGTVTASAVMPDQSYSPEDLALLEELADRAAVAIENSQLYEETMQARARADQLYAFAHAVSTADNLDDVYQAALSAIETALGTPRLAILIGDQDGRPRFRAWRNLSDGYRQAVDGHSPWSRDATQFEPVLVADALNDPALRPFVPLFQQEGIGALGFFPLVNRGTLLGKFMVYFGEPHAFQAHEIEVASSIANHLASVVTRFRAISRLEDTIKSNELFAAVLAHDLRNPLSAIMNSAQVVLMRQEGRGAMKDTLDGQPLSRILRSGQRMTAMIDQLLDFTRARAGGGIDVAPHATNLSELCSQAIGELELAHPDWTIRCESRGNTGGMWDAARMLQVISNIVSNAGQHGTEGGDILVTIDGTDVRSVRLEVRNDGVIAESQRANLFEPFSGSRRAQSMGGGGLGLGLFIVRAIVKAHGGDVSVACSDTQTIITVTLPRT